jgi:hypothetical protein
MFDSPSISMKAWRDNKTNEKSRVPIEKMGGLS